MFADLKYYFCECAKHSFGSSWTSANNLAGALIVGLDVFANGALHVIPGATDRVKYSNGALSLIVYTLAASGRLDLPVYGPPYFASREYL